MLTMMNCLVDNFPRQPRGPPHQPPAEQPIKKDDEALVFAQGTDKDTPPKGKPKTKSSSKSSSSSGSVSRGPKYRMVICKNCGQQGHVSLVCPQNKPPEQIHAMVTAPDDASVSSADNSILIIAQMHDAILPPQHKSYADAVLTQVAVLGPSPPSAQD